MSRSFVVKLGDAVVGRLSEDDEGVKALRFSDDYREMADRPVLSQSFEDNLERVYSARRGRLPSFFANLVPEGQLRAVLAKSLGIAADDDLGLLAAAADDLPGALRLVPDEYDAEDELPFEEQHPDDDEVDSEQVRFRFSLAGVQLKFSVLRGDEKVTIPTHGSSGDWILKLPSMQYARLPINEYTTLEWARAMGFEVPDCRLEPRAALPDSIRPYVVVDEPALAIRRYDRIGERRVHQEDFAQVTNLHPDLKYQLTYEKCAALVAGVCGEGQYFEFVRRLAFVIASGNMDAHLKNWSLVYMDGIHASLSPLYDQVCTLMWPDVRKELALKFVGRQQLADIDASAFDELAVRARADRRKTVEVAEAAVDAAAAAWKLPDVGSGAPPGYVEVLEQHWRSVPLLARASLR